MAYKLIAFVVLFACSLFGQQTNTIYQQVMSDSTGGNSSSVRTIGQSMHYFMVKLKDAPGKTCNPAYPSVVANFTAITQGSYDNSFFFSLPQTLVTSSSNGTGKVARLFVSKGAFPYVNINIGVGDATNCRVDVWYTGVLFPFNATDSIGGSVISGGFVSLRYVQGSSTASGDTSVINAPSIGYSTTIYGMQLCNQAATGQTLFVQDTVAGSDWYEIDNMSAGQCITFPPSYIPLFTTIVPNSGLKINASAATRYTWAFWYRYE